MNSPKDIVDDAEARLRRPGQWCEYGQPDGTLASELPWYEYVRILTPPGLHSSYDPCRRRVRLTRLGSADVLPSPRHEDGYVGIARGIAYTAHLGQIRRNGDPYITHPKRMADRAALLSPVHEAASWVHDTVEDTRDQKHPVTLPFLAQAGLPKVVVETVDLLTRGEDERYDHFIGRIVGDASAKHRIAAAVKALDILDNTSGYGAEPTPDKVRDYRNALRLLSHAFPDLPLEILRCSEGFEESFGPIPP